MTTAHTETKTRPELPRKVSIGEILSSRYPDHKRPQTWDDRTSGRDVVLTLEGERIELQSDGGQSPPKPGWVLMLTEKTDDASPTFRWTLYGLPGTH